MSRHEPELEDLVRSISLHMDKTSSRNARELLLIGLALGKSRRDVLDKVTEGCLLDHNQPVFEAIRRGDRPFVEIWLKQFGIQLEGAEDATAAVIEAIQAQRELDRLKELKKQLADAKSLKEFQDLIRDASVNLNAKGET